MRWSEALGSKNQATPGEWAGVDRPIPDHHTRLKSGSGSGACLHPRWDGCRIQTVPGLLPGQWPMVGWKNREGGRGMQGWRPCVVTRREKPCLDVAPGLRVSIMRKSILSLLSRSAVIIVDRCYRSVGQRSGWDRLVGVIWEGVFGSPVIESMSTSQKCLTIEDPGESAHPHGLARRFDVSWMQESGMLALSGSLA